MSLIIRGTKTFTALFVIALMLIAGAANFSLQKAPHTQAAADDYTVIGGNPFALPPAGSGPGLLPDITITDVGGDDFLADPEIIRIDINTAVYGSVIFDGVPFATVAGSCGYNNVDAIIPNSLTQIDVIISGGGFAGCADGQTIDISGLGLLTVFSSLAPGPSPLISVDNNSTSPGSPVFTSDNIDLPVLPGFFIGADVEPGSLNTGASGNVSITFAGLNPVPPNGKINVIFPAGFVLNDAGATIATANNAFNGTTYAVSSAVGSTVTLTGDGAGIGIGPGQPVINLTLSNIMNPGVAGSTGFYTIQSTTATDQVLDEDTFVAADTILANPLTGAEVEPADLNAGATSQVTVSFTTSNNLLNNDKIKVTFGASFDVSGATGAACATLDGTITTSVNGQVVILTRDANGNPEAPGAIVCTIDTIVNPALAGSTGPYTIRTTDNADAVREENTTVTADTILASSVGSGRRNNQLNRNTETDTSLPPTDCDSIKKWDKSESYYHANRVKHNGLIYETVGQSTYGSKPGTDSLWKKIGTCETESADSSKTTTTSTALNCESLEEWKKTGSYRTSADEKITIKHNGLIYETVGQSTYGSKPGTDSLWKKIGTCETDEANQKLKTLLAPTNLSVEKVGSASIVFSWEKVVDAEQYIISALSIDNNEVNTFKVTGTRFTHKGLEPATAYDYSVQAESEVLGTGPSSDTVNAITLQGGFAPTQYFEIPKNLNEVTDGKDLIKKGTSAAERKDQAKKLTESGIVVNTLNENEQLVESGVIYSEDRTGSVIITKNNVTRSKTDKIPKPVITRSVGNEIKVSFGDQDIDLMRPVVIAILNADDHGDFTFDEGRLAALQPNVVDNNGFKITNTVVSISNREIAGKTPRVITFRTNVLKTFTITLPNETPKTLSFQDVNDSHEKEAINLLVKLGVLKGFQEKDCSTDASSSTVDYCEEDPESAECFCQLFPDHPECSEKCQIKNLFKPNKSLERAGTSKIVSLMVGLLPAKAKNGDTWYDAQKRALRDAKITNGKISADTPENRANLLALIAKSNGINIEDLPTGKRYYKDVPESEWYFDLVSYAVEQGWIQDGNSILFNPSSDVTRNTAAGWVVRAYYDSSIGNKRTSDKKEYQEPAAPNVCEDSTERFQFEYNGKKIKRNCDFAARKRTEERCANEIIREQCPYTCGSCPVKGDTSTLTCEDQGLISCDDGSCSNTDGKCAKQAQKQSTTTFNITVSAALTNNQVNSMNDAICTYLTDNADSTITWACTITTTTVDKCADSPCGGNEICSTDETTVEGYTCKKATPPSAPANLESTEITTNSISITWDTVSDATHYTIYLNGETLKTINSDKKNYKIVSLTHNTSYKISVSATSKNGNSEKSKSLELMTKLLPPSAPGDLKLASKDTSSATIDWDAPKEGPVKEYIVYVDRKETKRTKKTSFTYNKLQYGTPTTFSISAINDAGESDASDAIVVSAKPAALTCEDQGLISCDDGSCSNTDGKCAKQAQKQSTTTFNITVSAALTNNQVNSMNDAICTYLTDNADSTITWACTITTTTVDKCADSPCGGNEICSTDETTVEGYTCK
jgi:hypothetical protein